jgi:hypothetical protein
MKNDRFLLGILIFIGLLVVVAIGMFVSRNQPQTYMPDDSPESIVFNYSLALAQNDFTRAYGYISGQDGQPTQAVFQSNFARNSMVQDYGLRIVNESIIDNEAIVEVTVIYSNNGPFDSGYTSEDSARLVLENGAWKITYMPYPYWSFDWYSGRTGP